MTRGASQRVVPATITALTVGHVLAAMQQQGMDAEVEARRLSLPTATDPDFEWRVPIDAVEALFERGIARLGPDFPLQARPARPEANRSPVNMYCRTRSSVREGIHAAIELMDLVTDAYTFSFEELRQGGQLVGRLTWVGHPRPSLWWFDVADLIGIMRTVLGGQTRFLRMTAPCAPPPGAEALFGCPIEPGETFSILLPGALVEKQLAIDPALRAMTERWIAQIRPPRGSPDAIKATLRALGPTATASQLASALGMSERTLHRRLSEAGTSFRAELDALRAELASTMSGRRPAEEIAVLLGYSDSRAYRRAARRWSGVRS